MSGILKSIQNWRKTRTNRQTNRQNMINKYAGNNYTLNNINRAIKNDDNIQPNYKQTIINAAKEKKIRNLRKKSNVSSTRTTSLMNRFNKLVGRKKPNNTQKAGRNNR